MFHPLESSNDISPVHISEALRGLFPSRTVPENFRIPSPPQMALFEDDWPFPQYYHETALALQTELGVSPGDYKDCLGDKRYQKFFFRRADKLLQAPIKRREKRQAVSQLVEFVRRVVLEEQKEKERAQRKRKTSIDGYTTIKRMKILCALIEKGPIDRKEVALMADMSESRTGIALKEFEAQGLVAFTKQGHRYLWRVTRRGKILLFDFSVAFLQCDLQNLNCKKHCKNVTPPATIIRALFETTQHISKILREWGWYPRIVYTLFENHKVAYVMALLLSIQKRLEQKDNIKNPGAYIYAILHKKTSLGNRINNLAESALKDFPLDIRMVFCQVAQDLHPREFFYLAYSLKKRLNKGAPLGIGDVYGIAGWILKQGIPLPPDINQSCYTHSQVKWREKRLLKSAKELFAALV